MSNELGLVRVNVTFPLGLLYFGIGREWKGIITTVFILITRLLLLILLLSHTSAISKIKESTDRERERGTGRLWQKK